MMQVASVSVRLIFKWRAKKDGAAEPAARVSRRLNLFFAGRRIALGASQFVVGSSFIMAAANSI